MTNTPAFPVWELNGQNKPEMTDFGMSLRDYFAAKAMPAIYRDLWEDLRAGKGAVPDHEWPMGVAKDAYRIADAMLKARKT